MSLIKSVLKGFLRLLIQLVKPFGVLANYAYRGIKSVVVPLFQAFIYILKKLGLLFKWFGVSMYRFLLKPIYIVFKTIILFLYRVIKQILILLYTYILKPIYILLKKVFVGLYTVLKWIGIGLYKYLLKPAYIILKKVVIGLYQIVRWLMIKLYQILIKPVYQLLVKLFKGLWFILKKIGHLIFTFILNPIYTMFKWMGKGLNHLFHLIWRLLVKIVHFIVKIIKHFVRFIQPLWKKLLEGVVFLLKGLRFLFMKLLKCIEWLFKAVHWVIQSFIRGVKWIINKIIYLYYNQPEWLYRFYEWFFTQLTLLLYTLLWVIPKVILIDIPMKLLKVLYQWVKIGVYYVASFFMIILISISNNIAHLKHRLYWVKRLTSDLIFDFKDYYYIILLLPILIPIFVLFGGLVLIEVVFIHIFIFIQTIIHRPKEVIHFGYIPSLNLFKYSQNYTLKLKRTLGFQQKFKNAHSLMILFLWTLLFPIRLALAIVLLPWTLVVGLFYSVLYLKYHDQIDFVVDDFIRIPNETSGVIFAKAVKRYGHTLRVHIPEALYDESLQSFIINPELETFRLEVYIDSDRYQTYTVANRKTSMSQLIYTMNLIERGFKQQHSDELILPSIEGVDVRYELTHQGDVLYEDRIVIRPFSNDTDILCVIKQNDIQYEREIHLTTLSTRDLERLLLRNEFLGYQGLSVNTFLDPKLSYNYLKNEHLKGDIIHSKSEFITVSFKVVGLEKVYQMNIRVLPNPVDLLAFDKIAPKPHYDEVSKRYFLKDQIVLNGLIQPLEWVVDGVNVDGFIDLSDLAVQKYHVFYVKTFNGYRTFSKTFKLVDERYKAGWWDLEWEEILNLYPHLKENNTINPINLPNYGPLKVKRILWVSKKPEHMRSTGWIKTSGQTPFKVTLYQHFLKKKVVFITLNHQKNELD